MEAALPSCARTRASRAWPESTSARPRQTPGLENALDSSTGLSMVLRMPCRSAMVRSVCTPAALALQPLDGLGCRAMLAEPFEAVRSAEACIVRRGTVRPARRDRLAVIAPACPREPPRGRPSGRPPAHPPRRSHPEPVPAPVQHPRRRRFVSAPRLFEEVELGQDDGWCVLDHTINRGVLRVVRLRRPAVGFKGRSEAEGSR